MFTLNYTSVPETENASPNEYFSTVGRYCLPIVYVDLIVFRLDLQLHLLFPTEKQSVLHVYICFRRK